MTIFITGSNGKTASQLAKLLAPTHSILVASRNPKPDAAYPFVKFDWLDEETWAAPFQHQAAGKSPLTAAYLVSPDVQAARDKVIEFVKFANGKGVKRFVLLSAWEVPEGGPLLGRTHLQLKALGDQGVIEWTVLRPQFFMENFTEPYHLPTIRKESKIYTACGDGRKPYISTKDIAAVAHRALIDTEPHNTDYVLTGSESVSYDQVAEVLSRILGRQIEHVKLSKEALQEKLQREFGFADDMAGYLADLDDRVAKGLGWEPTLNVERLTGRAPLKLENVLFDLKHRLV